MEEAFVDIETTTNAESQPFVMEVNANPHISPVAGFPASLTAAGIAFDDFVKIIIANAWRRAFGE